MKRASAEVTASRPDREAKRMVAGHFEPETFTAFKVLAAQQNATTLDMLSKGLALLFREYNRPVPKELRRQLAELKRNG